VAGRKDLFGPLEEAMNAGPGPVVWMHCASLGEFEQGRPLIDAIRRDHPGYRILLTFFSPSGYEVRKRYPGADHVCYLPLDTARNAAKFLAIVRPVLAIFVKYEHWHHFLAGLQERGIPTMLVSAIFREGQPFFRPYGAFWRRMLQAYERIFVQDKASFDRLAGIGLSSKAEVCGDTRFDRVAALAGQAEGIPLVEAFCGNARVIVAGSTWTGDERILGEYAAAHPGIRFIIAPHEIHAAHLAGTKACFPGSVSYTELEKSGLPDTGSASPQVLLIDNIGMLSRLYRYADICYVGGGFERSGIHNILEAAVYGKPVAFGPAHRKSREAADLRSSGGGFCVRDAAGLADLFDRLLADEGLRTEAGRISAEYVQKEAGATQRIMRYIQENRLLTS
jgi:3-deoxy-D-manno-octulosonic-acid transferase